MHKVVASTLRGDPTILERGRLRVLSWRDDDSVHAEYVAAWLDLLTLGVGEVADALEMDTQGMRDLRQVSPFAGVLRPRERWAILRSVSGGPGSLWRETTCAIGETP